VAYLLNLKDTYEYPEARPFVEPAAAHGPKAEDKKEGDKKPTEKKAGGH
jgi:hypothetical protein